MKIVLSAFVLVLILTLALKLSLMRLLLSILFFCISVAAQAQINLLKKASTQAKELLKPSPLSAEEVGRGLKEALVVGAEKSVDKAAVENGFYGNKRIQIPFPSEATKMKTTLQKAGMNKQVIAFEKSLNRAAELASKEVFAIFSQAITTMTVEDALGILKGNDNAATLYLEKKTNTKLHLKIKPIVTKAIAKVEVTKYWNPLAKNYNAIPFTKKVNPDLEDYVTKKTIKGLFILIALEEKEIRNNPAARVSELLQKIFK